MNSVQLIGRLTRDPDIRWTQGQDQQCIARYTLAVDRRIASPRDGQQTADFISCVAFGRAGEFAEKYLHKGMKLAVTGRIVTGSYTNRDGVKVYTTDVAVGGQEFCESKGSGDQDDADPAPRRQDAAPAPPPETPPTSRRQELDRRMRVWGGNDTQREEDMPDGFMNIPDGIDEELPFN